VSTTAPSRRGDLAGSGGRRDAPRTLCLLGGFRLGHGDGDDVALPLGGQRLLAYLAVDGGRSRNLAAARLWADLPEAQALNSLRSTLHRIARQAPDLVVRGAGTLTLDPSLRVDVCEVVAWTRTVLGSEPDEHCPAPPAGVFCDELLPGWGDDWVLAERDHLQQLRVHALELYAERLARRERFGEALHILHRVLREEPLRESAHRVAIGVHLAEGNVAEALRRYEGFRAVLAAELGIEPTERVTALVAGLRAAVPPQRARRRGPHVTHR
jgi:DNA-binding SARP family transcriptional activator